MRIIIKIIFFYCLLVSCYKPYNVDIKTNEKILAVEGMITNELASYHIRLSYALPFNSKKGDQPVDSAHVYVKDNLDNKYTFRDLKNGEYISDSLQFKGSPGKTYTLYIETSDGEIYRSEPQRLYSESYPDSVYAEADYRETISQINQLEVRVSGANILVDIRSDAYTNPRFRFTSKMVEQYFYAITTPPPPLPSSVTYSYYCWMTNVANSDINLTQKGYSQSSSSITKHAVCFIDDEITVFGIVYQRGPRLPDLSSRGLPTDAHDFYPLSRRILCLNQYTLNDETHLYYKSMDVQLRAEGKLFDPIAVQLRGNIKCTTNPQMKTLGFFEASSISRTYYIVGIRNPLNDQYKITKIPYIPPPEANGCWIDKVPPFWIN